MMNRSSILASIGVMSMVLAVQPAFLTPAAAQTTVYGLQDLGALPGTGSSVAQGINEFGDVAGWSQGSTALPFIFTAEGGMTALPLPPDTSTSNGVAYGLNDVGQVVGSAGLIGARAVRWTGGILEDLQFAGVNPPSDARGINAFGDTVGFYTVPGGTFGQAAHAYILTDQGGFLDIGPDGARSLAYDINDAGQVTGYFSAGANRAFRWSAAAGFENLGVAGDFAHSAGTAINEAGQVAGHLTTAGGNAEVIFRHTDGPGMEILGGFGEHNRALGINRRGDIVGEGRPTPSGLIRGFIHTDSGGLQTIDDLLDPALNWHVLSATDINDIGEVAAVAINNGTGDIHAVRLVPSDAPPTIIAPSGLFATAASADRIDLGWADNSGNEEGFDLERREVGSLFTQLAIVAPDTTRFIDLDVQPGTTYEYRVRAFNSTGSSAFSNIATATTPAAPTPTVDDVAPRVSFVTPRDGEKVAGREQVEIAASDNVGVVKVDFLVDGIVTCTNPSGPLICEWDTRGMARGVHTLTGRAFDAAGNSGSQNISITIKGRGKSGS